jgi:DNA-binding GntR family transcriptional regulator
VVVNPEKPKAEQKKKPEQPAAKKENKLHPKEKSAAELLDERVYAQMKTLTQNGITEFTSTLLRDKLQLDKEIGRGQVRSAMKRLAKDGKVTISLKQNTGKRKQYVYRLKE